MQRGQIVSVSLENFMTYGKFKFEAGHGLNVIIGPNGCGKSSILCAMVLGLGGKPKSLGRASSLNAFIRSNCKSAKIQVELFKPNGRNNIITRNITQDSKSTWMLDGNSATQKQIEDFVAGLKIQVDNLCEFLPQDRVADFSKMNAQQLLENTEKCIGSGELATYHDQLKELRKQYMDYEKQLKSTTSRLESEEQKNNRLAADVDSVTQKRALLEQVKSRKQKLAWLRYSNEKKRLMEMKSDKEKAERNLKNYENKYEPKEREIKATRNKLKDLEKNLGNVNPEMNKQLAVLRDKKDRIERVEDMIKENKQDYERKLQAEEQRKQEVIKLQQKISKLQNDMKNINKESGNAIQAEIENLRRQSSAKAAQRDQSKIKREDHREQLESIHNQITKIEAEKQQVEDIPRQRMESLARKNRAVYNAIQWLRDHRQDYEDEVYLPMALEINVANPKWAKFVETAIPTRDLFAFTFVNKKDMNQFVTKARDSGFPVSAVHSGPEHPSYSSFKPNITIDKLSQYGLHTYLTDTMSAPEPIMKYLCRMYRLHNIPIGDKKTFDCFEQVPEVINCFFSDKYVFYASKSKYTGLKSTRTSETNNPVFLTISVDNNRLQQLDGCLHSLREKRERLKHVLEDIQKEIHLCDNEIEALCKQRKELMDRLENQRTIQDRLRSAENQMHRLESGKINIEAEKTKLVAENKKLVVTLCKLTSNLVQLLESHDKAASGLRILQLEVENLREELYRKENESRELLRKREEAQELLNGIDELIAQHKNEVNRLSNVAKETTNGLDPSKPAFSAYKDIFRRFADTEDELEREIQDHQAKADCIRDSDAAVLSEFETRKGQIATLKDTVEAKEKKCKEVKEAMDKLREKWLPPLITLISQISLKYSECFARLQCAGEVILTHGGGEEDYEQYGLKIKVKYRDGEQLQELNHQQQSGGERAVATAIYMIALQELIRVPFCCADEINQGMDAVNERMIFELLTATTQKSGIQYFLLTPKLLPTLEYSDDTRVIVVHSAYSKDYDGQQINLGKLFKRKA